MEDEVFLSGPKTAAELGALVDRLRPYLVGAGEPVLRFLDTPSAWDTSSMGVVDGRGLPRLNRGASPFALLRYMVPSPAPEPLRRAVDAYLKPGALSLPHSWSVTPREWLASRI